MLNHLYEPIIRVVGVLLSLALAVCMTIGLFYFMYSLISSGEQLEQRMSVVRIVDATMPEIEIEVIEEIDKPELIEEVVDPQPQLEHKSLSVDSGPALNIERAQIDLGNDLDLSMASVAASDGDYLPLVAIAPNYPSRARDRGIEGWCLVSFTVDARGNVVEDTITVVDSEPAVIFDVPSMRAAARFRFQPRTKDGAGVEVSDVQYLFNYSMARNVAMQ